MHEPTSVDPFDVTDDGAPAPIVSLAYDFWTDIPRCRHHVMGRLAAAGHRVLFVSPEIELRDAVREGWRTRPLIRPVTRVADNLYTFVPPAWAPSNYRYPRLDRVAGTIRLMLLRAALAMLGMRRPIVYVWHPDFVDVAQSLDARLIVYHCYDEYAAFTGANRARMDERERRLLARADLVFAVSEGLCERRRALNPNVVLLRNGVDYPRFAAAQSSDTPVPDDIAAIRGPIVGCITRVVPEYFDAALLRHIFSTRPDWSLVVIGPEVSSSNTQAVDDLRTLKQLPNVHFLGGRPFERLPGYLRAMHACVIPYRTTENKMLADPLKLYEYLAAGKPVVCPPLAIDAQLRPFITAASGPSDWIDALATAIDSDTPQRVRQRQDAARAHGWDDRVSFLRAKMRESLTPPTSRFETASARYPRSRATPA